MNVSNPFGSFLVSFCSKVHIQNSIGSDLNCSIKPSNLDLYINNNLVRSTHNIYKGFSNNFTLNSSSCQSNLKTYWTISQLDADDDNIERPVENFCIVLRPNNHFEVPPNALNFGLYSITAYAVDSANEDNFAVLTGLKISVVSTSIVAALNSGLTYIDLNWNEDLILDFYEDSYDPDLNDRNDRTGMKFYFVCTGDKDLSSRMKNEITNYNFGTLNQELNLAFYQQDWLYFFENTCFFRYIRINRLNIYTNYKN